MVKRIVKLSSYKNWSIKVKLLTITIFLIVFSVLIASSLSYYRYTRDFQQQAAERTQQTIEQLSFNINTYLEDVIRLSMSLYYNNQLMDTLEKGDVKTASEQLEKRRLIEDLLNGMMIQPRNDILSVYIIADEVYRGGRYPASNYYNADYKNYDWYKQALKTQETIFVPAHLEQLISNPKFKVFSIVKRIDSIKNVGKPLGVVKVDADYTGIESICNKVDMGKEGGLFIFDENNTTIFSSVKNDSFKDIYSLVKGSNSPYFTTSINGKKYLLNSTVIPRANWTIITANSINELNKNAIQTRNTTFLMALLSSLFAIIILIIFTQSFLRPLMIIIKLMKEVKRGNFQVKFPEERNDEIGYLGSSFNTMVTRISSMMVENTDLVKEVYEAKFLQKEAQISALYGQIRPHFIYNTLNMISLLMQCGRNEKAIDNINKLSILLRGITHLDKEITVEKEISLLDSYLSIQSSRYDGRLEYIINIDKELYSYSIPALILQPIAENSIVHGCEKRKEKTIIKIYNTYENENIVFIVEDNADGMDEKTLEKLRKRVYSSEDIAVLEDSYPSVKSGGIGLVNVNKRIKIRFGEQYGLIIDSNLGKGTSVRIVLPKEPIERSSINV